eukprot:15470133-Alexandrium_andersonii.AAC.1
MLERLPSTGRGGIMCSECTPSAEPRYLASILWRCGVLRSAPSTIVPGSFGSCGRMELLNTSVPLRTMRE